MATVSIIYWSGTGNTEIMAEAIKEGAESAGVSVSIKLVDNASIDDVKDANAVILGSPSTGAEVLADEMEDFVSQMEKEGIKNKIAGAFGSYDWGDGQWMMDFVERLKKDGFGVVEDGLTIHLTPGDEEKEQCREYGKQIAEKVK
ncbi:MAG: flavodoxin [Candidatus Altiarchaeum hamiconexum]|uniref:Flavodoxin n=1 Tax=Candidatus Altarchaeum hamiconexum TaxID=1803513 RepID=A0A8J8CFT3_9ARCH|nr:flavodoxin [Candidatus Altarchaeum hamiconexum]OIQ04824.1 MAG: flavodoxin [Candidatus Altarchaeum sp. CG2_30_32_3053]